MVLLKIVVLYFIVFLCASPSSELMVFDPGKWLYRTRSEGLTGYSCLSVLLPLWVRLGHLSWNNSGGSATVRLGLSTDGFTPYDNSSTSYSCWPVFIMPYNPPPNKCMKEGFIFLALIMAAEGHEFEGYGQDHNWTHISFLCRRR